MNYSGDCHACNNIRKPVATEKDGGIDVQENDLLDQLFSGANQQMLSLMKQQVIFVNLIKALKEVDGTNIY